MSNTVRDFNGKHTSLVWYGIYFLILVFGVTSCSSSDNFLPRKRYLNFDGSFLNEEAQKLEKKHGREFWQLQLEIVDSQLEFFDSYPKTRDGVLQARRERDKINAEFDNALLQGEKDSFVRAVIRDKAIVRKMKDKADDLEEDLSYLRIVKLHQAERPKYMRLRNIILGVLGDKFSSSENQPNH